MKSAKSSELNKAKFCKQKGLLVAGVPGSVVGNRAGTQVHRDRKKAGKQGYTKHKSKLV